MAEWINKQKILDRVREEELYYHYAKIDINKKNVKSIIRNDDKHSSFKFHRNKEGRIKWSDFGTTYTDCDFFDLTKILYNWSFYETLVHINNDFKLGFNYSDKYKIDFVSDVNINSNDCVIDKFKDNDVTLEVVLNKHEGKHIYTKEDLKYWNKGFIDKHILQKEKVYSVAIVLLNGIPIWYYNKKNPIFLYVYKRLHGTFYKIYRPLNENKKYSWISNLKEANKVIDGIEDIDLTVNYLIITKSKKDKMILKYPLGYNAVAVQSESTGINSDIMDLLWSKYEVIYNLYDNDKAGIELGEKFALENSTIPIWYDKELEIKDSWDCGLKYGIDESKIIINKMLI